MSTYPYFGVPPTRVPRPATDEPTLVGKRVILSTPDGFIYDMRAASEVQTDGAGGLTVGILTEQHHFECRLGVAEQEPVSWPAHLVWIE